MKTFVAEKLSEHLPRETEMLQETVSQDRLPPTQDFNPWSPKYKGELLISQPRY
jgi:hypothetical protein